ncbi:NUDIX hydrolase [Nonomuraea sp. SYSU D8015]|uniref:NUDIX hydrolase n=1 Tax=Nonomuraea sp. SYSU D8015 TaxID=2593644 RepID=UPI0016614BEE|nr:NUDIX hydrolase [Nonomuraea sp. SYSU D8015]
MALPHRVLIISLARHELSEGTGLDLPVGPLIAISFEHPSPGWDHPTEILLFDLGSVDSGTTQLTTQDPDIAEHRWAHPDEAQPLLGSAGAERLLVDPDQRDLVIGDATTSGSVP